MKKLGDPTQSQTETLAAIDSWLDDKLAKEMKSAPDLADCMRVFADLGQTLGAAIAQAEHILRQRGAIQFLTGHRSKGLEFPLVYHLDPWLCRQDEQDLNLRYVITTRSAHTLYEVDSRSIKWS
jgi:ATP-dependent exoDNAse (exonuclease V) beta subunit